MLEGIKVVEHATYMAAPGAGGILCDWGASVIKIEPPGGDPIRKFFQTIGTDITDNPVFAFDNRGKQSIVLDTNTEEGRSILKQLAREADVFLTNVRPGGLGRSGMDYESLSRINPKLVYCSLTGYGLEGEDRDRPGFDVASFWARSGVAALTIPKGEDLFALRTAFGDHTTSMASAAGICAALVEAQRTGKGRLVEASLLRAALYALGSDFAIQLFFGRIGSTKSRKEQIQPLMNFFQTKDKKWICVVPRQGEEDWPRLCKAFDLTEHINNEKFSSAKSRRQNNAELVELIDSVFAKLNYDEMGKRLDDEKIAWAPVQTLAEVAKDPQVISAGGIVSTPSEANNETFEAPGSPVRFPGADDGPKGPAPRPGQHTRQILESCGLVDSVIDEYFDRKIVA